MEEKDYAGLSTEELLELHENFGREISKYSIMEQGIKVLINSCYGTVSAPGFRYFIRDIGEGITLSGQLILRWGEERINRFLNRLLKTDNFSYVLYGDTDSLYLNLEKLVDVYLKRNPEANNNQIADFLDKFCVEKLQPELDNIFKELSEYTNQKEHKISFKRESIIKNQIQIAKKKYLYNMIDKEGVRYTDLQLGITGVEIVRSSTPEFCRDKLKDAAKIIMSEDRQKLLDYIAKVKKEFYNLSVNDIATPKSVNGVTEYEDPILIYKKGQGTPIHSRASILYNHYVKKFGLEKQYPLINDGDKIKYTYIKEPNLIGENVIAFSNLLPKEFELDDKIDYDQQWGKMFMSPINMICNAINMNLSNNITLESFFG